MRRLNGGSAAPKPPESTVILTNEQFAAVMPEFLGAYEGIAPRSMYEASDEMLNAFKGWLKEKPITLTVLQNYFKNAAMVYSNARLEEIHATLKRMFKWAHAECLIASDPMQFVVRPKGRINPRRRPYTYEEYVKLRDAAMYRLEVRWLVVACYNLGVRASGAAMMRWTAVNWDERVITTIEPKTKRLGIQSVIPFEPYGDVEKCLIDLHAIRDDRDDSFPGPGFVCKELAMWNCCNRTRSTLPRMMWHLCKRAGVEVLGTHSLRRAFCTNIANYSGLNAVAAMKMTGHTDYKSYAKYITVDGECLREGLTRAFAKVKERKVLMKQLKEKNDD